MSRPPLPSLTGLRAFEAFARLGSMTAAARELSVTHGAISRQVRALEARLGVDLVRGGRHDLSLTEAGDKLAQSLSPAFDMIAAALPGSRAEDELLVSCLGTLAMKWLIPRLPGFLDAHPGLKVRILESHAEVDFARDGVHAAIRIEYGPPAPGVRSIAFMDHWHGPVMSPALLARIGDSEEAILGLPRLHSETFRPAWRKWAARTGRDIGPASTEREFEHNSYMLEAAAAGLGVAIAPFAFAEADINQGRLVAPFGFAPVEDRYVYLRPKGQRHAGAEAFGRWLLAEGEASPRP